MTINTFEIQYASCQCRSWFVCMCAEEGFMHLGRGHERRPHNFTVILFHMKDPRLELQTHESSLACVLRYTMHGLMKYIERIYLLHFILLNDLIGV